MSGPEPYVVVVGGANVDVKAQSLDPAAPGTSNPGRTRMTPGGVGRSVAENLTRLGTTTHLVSAVGADVLGDWLLGETAAAGVHVGRVRRVAPATGTYTAVLDDDGELVIGVSDMAATDGIDPETIDHARELITDAAMVVVDGNLGTAALTRVLDLAHEVGTRVVLEPVSEPKARRLAPSLSPTRPVHAVTPNLGELASLTRRTVDDDEQVLDAAAELHARGVGLVWVHLGARGSLLSGPDGPTTLPATSTDVVDVTGAGDAMLAGFVHALVHGQSPGDAARLGQAAAALTVASHHTVRPDLTAALVEETLAREEVR